MADAEQVWIENVEDGRTRTIPATELEQLRSPWRQITAGEAVRAHVRGVR